MLPQKGDLVFELRMLHNLMKKNADAHLRLLEKNDQLTRMHHWIIGFLFDNKTRNIYQRDIESEFRISRSTTSNMLSLMEKKGLIQRQSVESDARLKKVVLTEKAERLHNMHVNTLQKLDAHIESALSPEEKADFLRMIDKLRSAINASVEEAQRKTEE